MPDLILTGMWLAKLWPSLAAGCPRPASLWGRMWARVRALTDGVDQSQILILRAHLSRLGGVSCASRIDMSSESTS